LRPRSSDADLAYFGGNVTSARIVPQSAGATGIPTFTGWLESARQKLTGTNRWKEIEATWTVPKKPDSAYADTSVYFAFPGLGNDPEDLILQPVLVYGYPNLPGYPGGDTSWTLAAMYISPKVGEHYASVLNVSPGDSIYGSVTLQSCGSNQCNWDIYAYDYNTLQHSEGVWADSAPDRQDIAAGGAVEVYRLPPKCGYFPPNGVFFNNINLYSLNGPVTPTWHDSINIGSNPNCQFNVYASDSAPSRVYLYHNTESVQQPPPTITVTISGPSQVPAHKYCTWSVAADGGTQPYLYSWLVNGTPVGGDSSSLYILTPSSQFVISAVVVDSTRRANGQDITVNVGGVQNCWEQRPMGP